jgi:hypothetical protein
MQKDELTYSSYLVVSVADVCNLEVQYVFLEWLKSLLSSTSG